MRRSRVRKFPSRKRSTPIVARHRAQVEPLAALAALFVLGVALATYAAASASLPSTHRDRASPTLDRATALVTAGGVVDPSTLAAGLSAAPDGYRMRLTLRAAGARWRAGPDPPPTAETAGRTVGVRIAPGRVRSGRLRVAVWR